MTELLKKINESNLSPNQYFLLYAIKNKLEITNFDLEAETRELEGRGLMKDGAIVQDLFASELEDKALHFRATVFGRVFPPIIIPSTGVHARGKTSQIKVKLKAFLSTYNYTWDVIMTAAEQYVRRYQAKGYAYMQNAGSFIFDKNGDSTLALECDTLEYHSEGDNLLL